MLTFNKNIHKVSKGCRFNNTLFISYENFNVVIIYFFDIKFFVFFLVFAINIYQYFF